MLKEVVIYIDLDHTLLNTERYKQWLGRSWTGLGVDAQKFDRAYRDLRGQGPFQVEALAKLLFADKRTRFRAVKLLSKRGRAVARFLYSDALPFLKKMRRRGAWVILYTYGDRAFQQFKINSMPRLRALLDQIIIVEDPRKDLCLPRRRGLTVMIDDRPEVLEHYARRNGVIPCWIARQSQSPKTRQALKPYCSLRAVERLFNK